MCSRIHGVLVSALAVLFLGACSTDLDPVLVETTPVSFHESFAEMSFKQLPVEEEVRLSINYEDPVFSFRGGLSRYEALALPALPQPYVLKIESELVRDGAFDVGTIFFPVLTFLDSNKSPIRTFDALPYVTQKKAGREDYILALVQVSDQLEAARYVVIHTQDDKLHKAIGRDGGKDLMQSNSYTTMMFAPSTEPLYRYEFASSGWIRVMAVAPTKSKPPRDTAYFD